MWVGQAAVWCDNPIVCLHSTDWHRQGHGAGMLLRVVWAKGTSAWHRWRCRFPQTPPRTLSIFRPALERNSTGFPRPSMGQNRICSVVCCGPLGWGWPTAMHAAQKSLTCLGIPIPLRLLPLFPLPQPVCQGQLQFHLHSASQSACRVGKGCCTIVQQAGSPGVAQPEWHRTP